jgi:ABC-2 type transport system permease protein
MKQILTVFSFTFRDAVRKKAFIISSAIMALLVVALFSVPSIINAFKKETPATRDKTCYYIDAENSIPGGILALSAYFADMNFVPGETGKIAEYTAEVKNDGSISVIEVVPGGAIPELKVYKKDFMRGLDAAQVSDVLSKEYIRSVLKESGLGENADIIDVRLNYTSQIVNKMDVSGYVVGLLLTMVMFFAIYFYGYGVAMSIATEKSSRVMETLVVSAPPSRILIGKCAAMGAVGLVQLAGLILVGAVSYNLLLPDDFTIMGMPLAFSSFSLSSALLILLYFLLGYFLYAVLNSVCGATVSRMEDLNTAMMPVVFLSLVSFYLSYFANIASGGETFSKIVTIIPFTAPFVIPFRLLNESVPAGEIVISLILLAVLIAVITRISVRLYSASVLHYGKRPKIKTLLKTPK